MEGEHAYTHQVPKEDGVVVLQMGVAVVVVPVQGQLPQGRAGVLWFQWAKHDDDESSLGFKTKPPKKKRKRQSRGRHINNYDH
jgi:hypothetical protein